MPLPFMAAPLSTIRNHQDGIAIEAQKGVLHDYPYTGCDVISLGRGYQTDPVYALNLRVVADLHTIAFAQVIEGYLGHVANDHAAQGDLTAVTTLTSVEPSLLRNRSREPNGPGPVVLPRFVRLVKEPEREAEKDYAGERCPPKFQAQKKRQGNEHAPQNKNSGTITTPTITMNSKPPPSLYE